MSAALYLLGDIVDVIGLPVIDLDEGIVELSGRIVGIHQLPLRAPTLGGPLLEKADRVTIAVIEVADSGFLVRRRQSNRGCARRQTPAY